MSHNDILNMEPHKLLDWLADNFTIELPSQIITPEDMDAAAKLLLHLTSAYSYLISLSSAAKLAKRDSKRNGTTTAYQDAVDRADIIQNMADLCKQQYSAVSRAVTIHIENNAELRMTGSGGIRR